MQHDPNELQHYDVKLNTETGELKIDVMDIIRQLNDEQKEDLLLTGGYWAFVSKGLIKDISSEFARAHYNFEIHEIREALLTSSLMPTMLKAFLEGLMSDFKGELERLQSFEKAYYKIYNHPAMQDEWSRQVICKAHNFDKTPLPRYGWVAEFVDRMLQENGITLEPYQGEGE